MDAHRRFNSATRPRARLRKACDYCRKSKMKCEKNEGSPSCVACERNNTACIITSSTDGPSPLRLQHGSLTRFLSFKQTSKAVLYDWIYGNTPTSDLLNYGDLWKQIVPGGCRRNLSYALSRIALLEDHADISKASMKSPQSANVLFPLPAEAELLRILLTFSECTASLFPLFREEIDEWLAEKTYLHPRLPENPASWAALNVSLSMGYSFHLLQHPSSHEDGAKCKRHLQNALATLPCLLLGDPNLTSVQALLGMVALLNGRLELPSTHAILAVAIRQAHTLGIHRVDQMQNTDSERRARVFWMGYIMDKMSCSIQGLSPLDDYTNNDIAPPDFESNTQELQGLPNIQQPPNFQLICRLSTIKARIFSSVYATEETGRQGGHHYYIDQVPSMEELEKELSDCGGLIYSCSRREADLEAMEATSSDRLVTVLILLSYYHSIMMLYKPVYHNLSSGPGATMQAIQVTACINSARKTARLIRYYPLNVSLGVRSLLNYVFTSFVVLTMHLVDAPTASSSCDDLQLLNELCAFLSKLIEGSQGIHLRASLETFLRACHCYRGLAERAVLTSIVPHQPPHSLQTALFIMETAVTFRIQNCPASPSYPRHLSACNGAVDFSLSMPFPPRHPRPQQPRKRTKTFTGCWTCRSRKIKCDETRPRCSQCSAKGLDCEGYGVRLQWLPPATDADSLHAELPAAVAGARSLRRHVPIEPPATVLGWSQIDDILCYVDSLASLIPADGDAHVHHFGVFSIPQQRRSLSSSPTAALTEPQTLPQSDENDQVVWPGVVDPGASFSLPTESPADYTDPYYSEADAAWGLCRLHDNLDFCVDFTRPEELDASTVFSELAYSLPEYTVPSPPIGEDSHILEGATIPTEDIGPEKLDKIDETQLQTQTPIIESPKTLVVPAHEQLLMEHYRNRVVNLFCVIDNAKSPWKTIHLTRVLQCAGELSFGGSTTTIRNALRNALLAISAFCLSNDHRAGRRLEDARKWETIASRYRCDAIGLLKDAVQSHLHQEDRPKYKEFVATTLSMITINVMSGDTSTCGMHLDGAEQLISYMSARKTRFSNKARSLHRIYLYLRVIYESTAVRRHRTDSSRFSPSFGSRRTVGPRPVIAREHILLADDNNESSPSITKRLAPRPTTSTVLSSYECIYGVPQSLLLLLKACIELIDEVDDERTKSGTLNIPEPLNRLCDDLESEILDWPLEDREPQSATTSNANIIYHQTRAFLNALIIYFSQSIRLLGFRYLRQYVQAVLESIEAIEEIKAETKIVAAPLFWPAFIAATEAFEPLQQERFRAWYDRVQVYGIASVRTGIQVVQEVWRSGPVNSQRQMQCSWRGVVERTGDCLMLT